ncbi:hypothetical protein ACJ6WD_38310 [Streptomyces sp. VTCC 41912]|uniref:hypothetical protein n=1 Tax=Streptomyces sp. VTCC 41912 TaxID=3383243 RepID=UPI003896D1B4
MVVAAPDGEVLRGKTTGLDDDADVASSDAFAGQASDPLGRERDFSVKVAESVTGEEP